MPSGLRQGGGKSGSGDSRHSLIIWSSFPSASSFWRSSDSPIRRSLKKTKGGFVLPGCRCMKGWCNERREGVDKRVHIEGSDTKLWSAQGFEITWFHFQFLITAANPCKFCQNWFLLWLFWLFQQAIHEISPASGPLVYIHLHSVCAQGVCLFMLAICRNTSHDVTICKFLNSFRISNIWYKLLWNRVKQLVRGLE